MHFLDTYKHTWYCHIKDFFVEDIYSRFDKEIDIIMESDWINRYNLRTPYTGHSNSFPERIDPILDRNSFFRDIATSNSLVGMLEEILGSAPQILKHKLIIKAPWEIGYPLHQDYSWWYRFGDNPNKILSVLIPLDDANKEEQWIIEMCPGKHRSLYIKDSNIPKEIVEDIWFECIKTPLEKWDILIFHSCVPHKSQTNTSNVFRKTLLVTYILSEIPNIETEYYKYYLERENRDWSYFI
jgi:hypothetical protein